MTDKNSKRAQSDKTIYLFNISENEEVYMHPKDTSPKDANKFNHCGHNDWQTPDMAVLSTIFNKIENNEFSKTITNSFSKSSTYISTDTPISPDKNKARKAAIKGKNHTVTSVNASTLSDKNIKIRPIRIERIKQ